MVKTQSLQLSLIAKEQSNRFDVDFLMFQALSEKKGYLRFSTLFDVVEKEKVEMPEEFKYCEIGHVEKTGDIDPVLLNENQRDELNENFFKKIEKGDIISPDVGDILLSSVRPNLKKFVYIDKEKRDTFFTKAFIHLRPKKNGLLLYYMLRSVFFNNIIFVSRQGKGYPTLKNNDLLCLNFDKLTIEKVFQNGDRLISAIQDIEKEIKQLKLKPRKPQEIIDEVFAEEFHINFEFLLSKHSIKGFIANFYDFQKSNELRFSVKHIYFSKILSQMNTPLMKFKKYFTEEPLYGAAEPAIDGVPNDDVRYVRITDIDDIGNLLDDEWKTVATIDNSYVLKNGDFLFARSGNTVGKSFLYNEKKHGKAIFAGYFIRFRFDHEKLNPLFLLYYSKSVMFNIWKNSLIRVMGQPNINAEEYKNLLIPNISLARQDQIVSKIKTLLEAQEAKRAEIEQKRGEIEKIIEKVLEN